MSTVASSDAADAGLNPLEILMRRIVQHELGEPARVLGGLATGGRLQQAGGPLAGRDLVEFGSL